MLLLWRLMAMMCWMGFDRVRGLPGDSRPGHSWVCLGLWLRRNG
jgi:hypothetical protein